MSKPRVTTDEQVVRYALVADDTEVGVEVTIAPCPGGEYVRYTDYLAMKASYLHQKAKVDER